MGFTKQHTQVAKGAAILMLVWHHLFFEMETLEQYGIRVETDLRNEKIGFKIREAQMQKVPYMLVMGDKEMEQGLVAVRSRKDGDLGTMTLEAFRAKLLEEIASRAKS